MSGWKSGRCLRGTNPWLVLELQIQSGEELGVDPLVQPSANLAPWCQNKEAQVEGAGDGENNVPDYPPQEGDGENNVPDDPPQEGVREKKHEIHEIRDGKGESNLVCTKSVAEVLVIAGLDLHADRGIDGLSEGECRGEMGLGEFAAKDEQPLLGCYGRVVCREGLTGEVFPRLAGNAFPRMRGTVWIDVRLFVTSM